MTNLYNCTPITKSRKINFCYPKKSSVTPLQSIPLQPQPPLICILSPWVRPFQDFTWMELYSMCSFVSDFFHIGVFLRFILVASVVLYYCWLASHCVDTPQFLHPFIISEHLSYFSFGLIPPWTFWWTYFQFICFLWMYVFIRSRIAGCMLSVYLLQTEKLFSKWPFHFVFPRQCTRGPVVCYCTG